MRHVSGATGQPSQALPSAKNDPKAPTFHVNANVRSHSKHWSALADRGANGTVGGLDMRILHQHGDSVNVNGFHDHTVMQLPLVDSAGVALSNNGPVIVCFGKVPEIVKAAEKCVWCNLKL